MQRSDHPAVAIGQHSLAGKKPRNDDSYGVVVPRSPLLAAKGIAMVIADGLSTSADGRQASETAVHGFLEDYYATPESWTVKTSAARVLAALNRWLYALASLRTEAEGAFASTFSAAILKGGQAHLFHVGDSRIARLADGAIEPLTGDHRASVSRRRAHLTRALGRSPDLEVDYRAVPVDRGDVLIFSTDGVHEHLAARDMAALILAAGDDLDAAARRIVEAALGNGSPDNLTCQLVRIDNAGMPDPRSRLDRLGSLPFPPDLSPGMLFEGYAISREIAATSRSQLHLARDIDTGAAVVIKTPSANLVDDADAIERFAREEWVGRLLSNPHVMNVFEPERRRRFLYLVSEFIDGRTLAQVLLDDPRPSLDRVREIVGEIAKGLYAFHRREMVHRDLRPDNIMIDRDGRVRIVDFGSVKVGGLAETGPEGQGEALDGLATRDYAAPEPFFGRPADERFDQFSLGVIVYEMLSGRHPYGGGFRDRATVARARYRPLRDIDPAIPAFVDAAIAKAVAIDPDRRYEALSAFAADLTRPNPDLMPIGFVPLAERDPVAFWRTAFVVAAFVAAVLALLLLRR